MTVNNISSVIEDFIGEHALPATYRQLAERWFVPLLPDLVANIKDGSLKVLGIVGTQGSGKSTLAALLCRLLASHYRLNVVSISLDDFYLTRDERVELANKVHPLLATRGVPGTHDVALACKTIESLKALASNQECAVPSFNKAEDDRFPPDQWPRVRGAVDLVILEGWCLCSQAQDASALEEPINALEKNEDSDGVWRQYVNQQLQDDYPKLWQQVDYLLALQAPSFESVAGWRLNQEEKLAAKHTGSQIMDRAAVVRFVSFFERLTRNNLATMPQRADSVFFLDQQQLIVKSLFQKSSQSWLIFSDLDGTLLDHHDYSFEPARATLKALQEQAVPVILNTSKTFAELLDLRVAFNNQHPFIVENGAAIYIPKGYFDECVEDGWEIIELGMQRERLLAWLNKECQDLKTHYLGFSEMSEAEVMAKTGLDHAGAKAAMQRAYSEPMEWLGDDHSKSVFIERAQNNGLQVLKGGRFLHLQGVCDKGAALARLLSIYCLTHNKRYQVLAAGDSHNDLAMLNLADRAVVVRSPVHAPLECAESVHADITDAEGPSGWARSIQKIILDSNL